MTDEQLAAQYALTFLEALPQHSFTPQDVREALSRAGLFLSPVVRPLKCRPCASGLAIDEAMERQFVIHGGWPFLVAYLRQRFYFWNPTEQNITSQFYATDARIGWRTHLICIDGKAALYTDGHPDGIPEHAKRPGREPIY